MNIVRFLLVGTLIQALKRDLNGPEKHVVFQKINIPAIFPNLPHARNLQGVWCRFYSLYQVLQREDTSDVDIAEYESSIRAWVREFTEIYQTRHIIPYIHAFANHIPEFLKLHGSLSKFNQQGLEKMNDLETKEYLRSTNHHSKNLQAFEQLLSKKTVENILKIKVVFVLVVKLCAQCVVELNITEKLAFAKTVSLKHKTNPMYGATPVFIEVVCIVVQFLYMWLYIFC